LTINLETSEKANVHNFRFLLVELQHDNKDC